MEEKMPKYKCHKEVRALKIKGIEVLKGPHGEDRQEDGADLEFEESGFDSLWKSGPWMSKHQPEVGGYYVVYDDGYTSYSPTKAFEEGYSLI